MNNYIQGFIFALVMVIWCAAPVHATRCYGDNMTALAAFFAPAYIIGAAYDRLIFETKCKVN